MGQAQGSGGPKDGRKANQGSSRTGVGGRLILAAVAVFVAVLGVSYYLGTSPPGPEAGNAGGGTARPSAPASAEAPTPVPAGSPGPDQVQAGDSVTALLADTEVAWGAVFKASGAVYDPPTPVIFSGGAKAACGNSALAMGTFYCRTDGRLYIDQDFLAALRQRFPATGQVAAQGPGAMAEAYVIAHEVGHHVQNLLGNYDLREQLLKTATEEEASTIGEMFELQADCYAGVWLKNSDPAWHVFEQGDIEKGVTAATAVSNEMVRQRPTGYVMPDPFTYGTAEERVKWFRTGLAAGTVESCDNF